MQEGHSTTHHVVPVRTYLLVFAALMVLLVVTVAVSFFHVGVFNKPIALTIAITKAGLIMAYFMHLKYSSKLAWILAAMGFFWLIILLVITMGDYVARGTIPGAFGPQEIYNYLFTR